MAPDPSSRAASDERSADARGGGRRRTATRVLGLDPGSRHTGYGVIEIAGSRSRLVCHGRISTNARQPLAIRLGRLSTELAALLVEWAPDVAAVEATFHGVNTRSLIALAQARGALLATLAVHPVAVEEFSPAEVKSAVTGNGRADKSQVSRMVATLLGASEETITADAADALAVALCYGARQPLRRAVALRRGAQ